MASTGITLVSTGDYYLDYEAALAEIKVKQPTASDEIQAKLAMRIAD